MLPVPAHWINCLPVLSTLPNHQLFLIFLSICMTCALKNLWWICSSGSFIVQWSLQQCWWFNEINTRDDVQSFVIPGSSAMLFNSHPQYPNLFPVCNLNQSLSMKFGCCVHFVNAWYYIILQATSFINHTSHYDKPLLLLIKNFKCLFLSKEAT